MRRTAPARAPPACVALRAPAFGSHCAAAAAAAVRTNAGFYYKSGQKIASNTGGVVPKVYSDRFQPFLNDIPPRPEAAVREVIEAELGRPMGEVLSSFTALANLTLNPTLTLTLTPNANP